MQNLPTISGYGKYASDNYGVNCLRVDLGAMTLWFSYNTVVAFRSDGARPVCENQWGPTTGKHLNWIDGGDKDAKKRRLPRDTFEAALAGALADHGLAE